MRHVLLAVDETEASERAAKFVQEFFAGTDTAITAVNVARAPIEWGAPPPYGWVAPVPYGGRWPWTYRGDDAETVNEIAAQEEDHAKAVARAQAPPDADIDVAFGDPAEAIIQAADDEGADIIVVGSNHKSFLQRLIEPSVSERLVKETPRPVLVVG
jgi:nucleotide-binding universal stress UspA family protein